MTYQVRQKKKTTVRSGTAAIAHGFWAHIGSIPWATSNRQTSQLALRRRASRTARNLLLLCRTDSDPSTTAWLNPLSLGSKIDQPPKKCLSRAQPPSDFRDTSHRLHGQRFSLAQGQQRCARSNLCALLRRLGAMTQGVGSFGQKLKNRMCVCDEGCCTRMLLFDIFVLQ